jgi:osmotically-inducible protein OsmY
MTRHDRIGPLLVTLLGVVLLARTLPAAAQSSTPVLVGASPLNTPEVIVSATRSADDAVTAKVVQVLRDDPYLFVDHITVVTENGVVRLQGWTTDAHEMIRAVRLARRAAGKRRVLNEVEFIAQNTDAD